MHRFNRELALLTIVPPSVLQSEPEKDKGSSDKVNLRRLSVRLFSCDIIVRTRLVIVDELNYIRCDEENASC